MSQPPAVIVAERLLQVIGREFVDVAPDGWATGEIVFMRVGNTGHFRAIARDASGAVIGGGVTRTMMKSFDDLRETLAQPGKGTFLTATYRLRASDGSISVDYDYDHEPVFDAPIHPGHYVEELEQNPRAPELVPDWWREKVAQATQAEDS